MCIDLGLYEYVLQRFTAMFAVFAFDKILKTSRVISLIVIWKSCLNLLSYSEGLKATIIANKLIKFTGHLLTVVLIKSCGKLDIEEYFFLDAYIKLQIN